MKKLFCIYKSTKLEYLAPNIPSTKTEPNPLLFNIVNMFIGLCSINYNELPQLIQIGDIKITILTSEDRIVFSVDNKVCNLKEMIEKYDTGDIEGIEEAFKV